MASLASSPVASPNFADDDGVRTFLSELKLLVDDCFLELNAMVTKEFSDPEYRRARFKKGLKAIENWDSAVRGEETAHALQKFPTIAEKEYQHASTAFIRATTHMGQADLSSLKVRVPPFDMFLFYFFREIARSASMKNGDYFTMRYMDKDRYLCDMLYIVMRECLEVLDNSAVKSKPTSWREQLAVDDRLERRVVPGDSVSCVGTTAKASTTVVITPEPQAQASMVVIKSTDPENPVFIKADTKVTDVKQTFSVIKPKSPTVIDSEPIKAPSIAPPLIKAPSVAPPSKAPSLAPSKVTSRAPSVATKAPSVAPSVAVSKPPPAISKAPSVIVTKRAPTVITVATDERLVEVGRESQHARSKPPQSRHSSSSDDD